MQAKKSLAISISIIDEESMERAMKLKRDKNIKHSEVYMRGVAEYEKEDAT